MSTSSCINNGGGLPLLPSLNRSLPLNSSELYHRREMFDNTSWPFMISPQNQGSSSSSGSVYHHRGGGGVETSAAAMMTTMMMSANAHHASNHHNQPPPPFLTIVLTKLNTMLPQFCSLLAVPTQANASKGMRLY